ncbi:bacteriohemerythrin [Desulfovibrio gilichinskyi]|uniref:Hemerythrin n=1 Tax=Desulfovibrio gilichinskyi TaxID=1519643 RepID=A0A1X7D5P4_9BACT|nr:bacteriohemerythrin [Desulfovibrio gilichinskyi]SMF09315.1 hemerythrin [Desulfovibrio gilichinskyi]
MPMLEWNESLSINFTEIDDQHKELITMINVLYDMMISNNNSDQDVLNIISDLHTYILEHFGAEVRIMKKYDYPETPAHINEHKEFIAKVNEVENLCNNGAANTSMEILNYLSTWLVQHINDTDKRLGMFIHSQSAN